VISFFVIFALFAVENHDLTAKNLTRRSRIQRGVLTQRRGGAEEEKGKKKSTQEAKLSEFALQRAQKAEIQGNDSSQASATRGWVALAFHFCKEFLLPRCPEKQRSDALICC
jgi:hypothetical protein